MNWDQVKGNWAQVKGEAQQQWGKLTNDDLDVIEGRREEFVGRVQERYGIAKEEAEKQVDDFCKKCS
ncbi:MAG: CsbD family protein [Nitrosomonas sp.]|nr:CsbD family protein [Nitrosomonas sp.]